MPKRNFFPAFFILIFLSVLIFILGRAGFLSAPAEIIGNAISPLQRIIISSSKEDSKIAAENKVLISKLVALQKYAAENSALRDQFETATPNSQSLLPAGVVSAPSFVPGISTPEYLVIDRGEKDGVKVGSAVVVKDNLIGKVTQVAGSFSKVMLVSNPSISLSAKTISVKGEAGVGALGVLKGDGGESLILNNVLLSDSLSVGDYVTTKGDLEIDNTGYPPSLIVGKIASVEKKSSDLFQRAKVRSLIDFSRLTTVFVVLNTQ